MHPLESSAKVSLMKNRRGISIFIQIFCICGSLIALDLPNHFQKRSEELFSEAQKIRRALHLIPEPCFQEEKTAAFVADYLEDLGLKVERGIAGTGVKAVLVGALPGPAIGVRGDMDALPIDEATGLPFASTHPGLMHACGHDMHMTNVLITAKILSEVREHLPGKVVFIFQPCEEGAPAGELGGADSMIKAGVLNDPALDAMLGLHVMPDIPTGRIGIRPGPLMASVAWFYVSILGRSSHGAFPHQGIDAIYAASQAVIQFQALISRYKDPGEQAVLTVGTVHGGVRRNVLAERVELEGTVRSFSRETEDMIAAGMERILAGLKISLGVDYELVFERVNSFVYNDPRLTSLLLPRFREILGSENVLSVEPQSIGEDFASYSHRLPSVFFFLGVGSGADAPALHTPQFTVDEEALKIAPRLFAGAVLELLEHFQDK